MTAQPRNARTLDLRGLSPPEPLERILDALSDGGPWRFLLSREPLPLYVILRGEGRRYRVRMDAAGVELTVEARAAKS